MYNILRLNIKLFILNLISLILSKSRMINVATAEIKNLLMHVSMQKKYKKTKKTNYKNLFYYRSPMPSQSFFEKYYKKAYLYAKIRGVNQIVSTREINQLDFILNSKKNFNFKNKKILNFGAGHGGFSILASFLGANITEIDTTNYELKYFNKNIIRFSDFSNVQDKEFDLIYASHTLEHVTDISFVLKMFKKLSHNNTFYFFEVPNGKLDLNSGNVFHNYFFFKKFFEKIFFQSQNRSDHFVNILHKKRDGKFVEEDADDLVVFTNHTLNSDF